MKKILLVLIFSILFSSNAFSSNKFYVFGADSPGDKDSSLCAFDGNQESFNWSTSTYTSYGNEYRNCEWRRSFTSSSTVRIRIEGLVIGRKAHYKGKATKFANNHRSAYPDYVLNLTNSDWVNDGATKKLHKLFMYLVRSLL